MIDHPLRSMLLPCLFLVLTGAGCDVVEKRLIPPVPEPVSGTTCGANFGACQSGYTCIQKCGPPVARENDPAPGYYCETNENAKKPRMCPICLALNTAIDTPSGSVKVQDVTVGMKVWSKDKDGSRIIVSVLRISKTPVPATHQVVRLELQDGRSVRVSPNHPLVGGTMVGTLRAGDQYDGSVVASAVLEAYTASFTYDLLPDSNSGMYWANDVPLASTLSR